MLLVGITGVSDLVWCFEAGGRVSLEAAPHRADVAEGPCCHMCDAHQSACQAHLPVFDHMLPSDLTLVRVACTAGLAASIAVISRLTPHAGDPTALLRVPFPVAFDPPNASLATIILLI